VWDLWWTKRQWDRFFSEFFGFPMSVSFHCGSMLTHIIWGGRGGQTVGPMMAAIQRPSHRINMNNNNTQLWNIVNFVSGIFNDVFSCINYTAKDKVVSK
jgi:hypothetical protein